MVTERAAARMAVKIFFVFFMVNTPLKLCYMKGFIWVENDCRLLSCRRHRLRSRNGFFIAVLPLWFDFPKSSEKIKNLSQIIGTDKTAIPPELMFIIRTSAHFSYTIMYARLLTQCVLRRQYRKCNHFFPAALKSPFTITSCTAFPPTAALYARRIRLLTLSQRFVFMLALL